MDDIIQTCPKCQSSNASNKELKFLVGYCGHSICCKCFELMFQRNEENCPKCNEKLPKSSFRYRRFESDSVESYICYYQEVKRIYNCDLTDFDSLDKYNDYLEEVESLIHDLMNKEKNEDAKNRMRNYYTSNTAAIKMRRNRKDKDLEIYDQWEKEESERRRQVDDDMNQEKIKRKNLDEEITKRLISSDEPLEDVVRDYSRILEENMMISATGDGRFRQDGGKMYRYQVPSFMTRPGFQYASQNDLRTEVLLHTLKKPNEAYIRRGGYTSGFWMFRLRHFCE